MNEIELGTRLTLFLGEPLNVAQEFVKLSKRLYVPESEVPMYEEEALTELAGEILDKIIPGGRYIKREGYRHFHKILENTIKPHYKGLFTDLYNLILPQPFAVMEMPETHLSERMQSELMQEAIKSGKRLVIYTQSEVIMLECLLGIKEGSLNLEDVKIFLVEKDEITDVELLKGGRLKSFGDSFPGDVRSAQMKRYAGF